MIYSKVDIQNFRCFEKLIIDGLKQVNLITGQNNVGKTAFLEALFIMAKPGTELMFRTNIFRGMLGNIVLEESSGTEAIDSPINNFFHNFNVDKKIILSSEHMGKWKKTIISVPAQTTISMSTNYSDGKVAQSRVVCEVYCENSEKESFTNKMILYTDKQVILPEINRAPFFKLYFLHNIQSNPNQDAQVLSQLLEIKKDKEIIDALKILEPRLKDIKIRITGVDATILVDIGKER
ncbi:ATPase-like protein, partial [Candidatus Omnitrophus magneticus]